MYLELIRVQLVKLMFTSQKNSFPRSPQNHEIHDTSSELLIFVQEIP
jgi:hypothetical protein